MDVASACPGCGAVHLEPLIDFGDLPVSGVFRSDARQTPALAQLAFELCGCCGLVRQCGRSAARDYSRVDRATGGQLPLYSRNILERLKRLGVGPRQLVLEIGSNDGSFLAQMQEAGFQHLLGIEPSTRLASAARVRGFEVLNEYFDGAAAERLVERSGSVAGAVCRHVLEHVPDPLAFLVALRESLDPNGVALVEVPDGAVIPERMNVYELWDEHLHYFCKTNLVRMMERAGLVAQEVEVQPHLDSRNLLVWCEVRTRRVSAPVRADSQPDVALWRRFPAAWNNLRSQLAETIRHSARPTYAIGASHPQCNFINYVGIGSSIDCIIDDDPAKIGRFPAVAEGRASIISTSEFETSSRAGTLLLTGFGYPRWTVRIVRHAKACGMQVVDPRDFVETGSES